jgi:hypothetical protein
MADLYSIGYNNDNAKPPVNHKPNEGGGRVRYYYDTYLQGAAAGAIGDVIHMKKLPEGARILPGGKIFWGTGTATETLKVGVTGADASLLAATAAATAGSALLEAGLASGLTYETPAGGIEVLVTDGVAAIAAAQRITVHIPYVID